MNQHLAALVMALYAAALRILDPSTPHSQTNSETCGMGWTRQILRKIPAVAVIEAPLLAWDFFLKLGMSQTDFCSVWSFHYGATRRTVAERLRDLGDKYALKFRASLKRTKMDAATLLATARYIETHPEEYKQDSTRHCIFAHAWRIKTGRTDSDYDNAGSFLGLTPKQAVKLFLFRHGNLNWKRKGCYVAINNMPKQQAADLAAARIRRMVIQGN